MSFREIELGESKRNQCTDMRCIVRLIQTTELPYRLITIEANFTIKWAIENHWFGAVKKKQ